MNHDKSWLKYDYLAGDYHHVIDLKLSFWVCYMMYVVFQTNSIVIFICLSVVELEETPCI